MRVRVPAIFVFLALLLLGGPAAADPPATKPAAAKRLAAGLEALRHEHAYERVRGVALLALCATEPERSKAARALQGALFDPEPAIRQGAVGALVRLDARAAGGELVRLLGLERDVAVLPTALLALGDLKVAGADRVLTRFASHPEATVRASALTAAGDIGGPTLRRLVLNSLGMAGGEDVEWIVRSAAILALARIGRPADLAAIQRAYRTGGGHAHWLARSAIAKAVAALHPEPQGTLEQLLADPDPRVAVTAAAGLADAGYADVLLGHLRSGQSGVRAAAVGGVRQAELRRAAPGLKRMARYDASRVVRWAAAKVLFAWDDPYGDTLLLDALRSKEPAIWAEALALLAQRTGASHGRDVDAWRKELKNRRAR
jgi:HEAT repeat protein